MFDKKEFLNALREDNEFRIDFLNIIKEELSYNVDVAICVDDISNGFEASDIEITFKGDEPSDIISQLKVKWGVYTNSTFEDLLKSLRKEQVSRTTNSKKMFFKLVDERFEKEIIDKKIRNAMELHEAYRTEVLDCKLDLIQALHQSDSSLYDTLSSMLENTESD